MDAETAEVHRRVRRLLLAIATDLDDSRQQLLKEVGFQGDDAVDNWYLIACITAQEVVNLLDAEYIGAIALRDIAEAVRDHADKDLPPEQQARSDGRVRCAR